MAAVLQQFRIVATHSLIGLIEALKRHFDGTHQKAHFLGLETRQRLFHYPLIIAARLRDRPNRVLASPAWSFQKRLRGWRRRFPNGDKLGVPFLPKLGQLLRPVALRGDDVVLFATITTEIVEFPRTVLA